MQRGEKAVPLGLVDPLNLGMDGYRRRIKPMVVAVQGITYTLGIELMLAADIVVAADDCRFSQLEVQRGIMATGGATLRMAERAGMGNALLHLLTADVFDSAEALRLNFVQKVVPAAGLLAEAMRIAGLIAAQAPLAVVATRQNVLKAVEHGPLVAMHDFIPVQRTLSNSDDAAEARDARLASAPSQMMGPAPHSRRPHEAGFVVRPARQSSSAGGLFVPCPFTRRGPLCFSGRSGGLRCRPGGGAGAGHGLAGARGLGAAGQPRCDGRCAAHG
jgi:hypothetical protein